MKKQILFSITLLIAMSSMPAQATEAKNTASGKSTWTILKAAAKILIGANLALGGASGLIAGIPMIGIGLFSGNNPRNDIALMGGGITILGAAATAGGIALLYSGTNDLNENEEPA